jgi:hypothetical protein
VHRDARSAGPRSAAGSGLLTADKILNAVERHPTATDVLTRIEVPRATVEDWPAFAKLFGCIWRIKG